jgi:hypothetical protein
MRMQRGSGTACWPARPGMLGISSFSLVVRFADEGESIFKESEIFLNPTIPKNLIALVSVCGSWQERRDGVALTVHDRATPTEMSVAMRKRRGLPHAFVSHRDAKPPQRYGDYRMVMRYASVLVSGATDMLALVAAWAIAALASRPAACFAVMRLSGTPLASSATT